MNTGENYHGIPREGVLIGVISRDKSRYLASISTFRELSWRIVEGNDTLRCVVRRIMTFHGGVVETLRLVKTSHYKSHDFLMAMRPHETS